MKGDHAADIAPLFEAFGAAVFEAQLLEHGLKLLLMGIDLEREKEGRPPRKVDLDSPDAPKTIGRLFREVMSAEYLTDAEQRIISRGIKERNFLVHSYWGKKQTLAMVTLEGREWLIDDLTRIREICRKAGRLVSKLIDGYLARNYGTSMDELSAPLWDQFECSEDPPIDSLH